MLLALHKTHCTISFHTPKRDGAKIMYVKSIDAGRVPWQSVPELTLTVQELERAKYDFQAWRTDATTGKEAMTGELKNVDCTTMKKTVSIAEP